MLFIDAKVNCKNIHSGLVSLPRVVFVVDETAKTSSSDEKIGASSSIPSRCCDHGCDANGTAACQHSFFPHMSFDARRPKCYFRHFHSLQDPWPLSDKWSPFIPPNDNLIRIDSVMCILINIYDIIYDMNNTIHVLMYMLLT